MTSHEVSHDSKENPGVMIQMKTLELLELLFVDLLVILICMDNNRQSMNGKQLHHHLDL